MIYLYAIGERDGELVAFVRDGVTEPPAPAREALERHDRVVSRLAKEGAVLPVRFGTLVRDDEAIRELLNERRDELIRQIEHVRGRVEMGVRATWARHRHHRRRRAARTGTDFMRGKLARRAAAQKAAGDLHPLLAELSVDSVLTLCPREDTAFSAAYLVEREDVERFTERVPDDDSLTLTGPWPPYSFSA